MSIFYTRIIKNWTVPVIKFQVSKNFLIFLVFTNCSIMWIKINLDITIHLNLINLKVDLEQILLVGSDEYAYLFIYFFKKRIFQEKRRGKKWKWWEMITSLVVLSSFQIKLEEFLTIYCFVNIYCCFSLIFKYSKREKEIGVLRILQNF